MKKIGLALIGGALVLAATPALASTILAGPYKNHGDCNKALSFAAYDARKGSSTALATFGLELTCQSINGQWYMVVG